MTTEEFTNLLDTLNEAFRQIGGTIKEVASSIKEFFESLTSKTRNHISYQTNILQFQRKNNGEAIFTICIKLNDGFKNIFPISDEIINHHW